MVNTAFWFILLMLSMTNGVGKDLEGSRYGLLEISQHLPGGTEENNNKFQSGLLTTQLRLF
jgi:hypothetical protein